MRWTVVVPGALLPAEIATEVLAGARAPWLLQALARARIEPPQALPGETAAHLAWLWQQFGGSGAPVTAPYALHALDESAGDDRQCWHVDPIRFEFARDHLLVAPLPEPLAEEEAEPLAAHLRAALAEVPPPASSGLHRHGDHWLLTLAQPWSLRATPLDGALGQSAHEHWPVGADAALWRRLLNDVQMRWHAEPANDARERRGTPAVNGLWLHGGGHWAPLPRRPFATVASDDPVLRGWALASGLPRPALRGDGGADGRGDAISIRRDLLVPAQFEARGQWLERLSALDAELRALHQRAIATGYEELTLALCGRREVRLAHIGRRDNWRLWRRAPVASVLAEAA